VVKSVYIVLSMEWERKIPQVSSLLP
jgi:hypothetical protein